MLVPIDDHLVHRGDGVFDVIRCVGGKIYQMEAHLRRLERSAKSIALTLPPQYEEIREIISTLVRKGGQRDCIVRIIVSRGPGSFTTNPYDCVSSQLYIVIIPYRHPPDECYQVGIPIVTSRVPIKKAFFATIKSCNYLQNVLMKMEAIDEGCEYAIALDDEGFLAEGSTENVGIVSEDRILRFPGFEKTLAGITVERIFELSHTLVDEGLIRGVQFSKITMDEARRSSEMVLTGTSINILPVVQLDGKTIGNGSPGPVYGLLSEMLLEDMTMNDDLLTEVSQEELER
jgi:branched-chain amino acid aminotransferase